MPEGLTSGERVMRAETQIAGIEKALTAHMTSCEASNVELNKRLIRIERTLWIAFGIALALQYLLKLH